MTVLEQPTAVRLRRGHPLVAPVSVGFGGFVLAFAFSWVPSLWFDEAATVSGATRSIPQLVHMLQNVDLVHGLYYFAMHLWFDLVGYSPVTLRLPSALAIGVAAALLVVLVSKLAGTRVAIIAGIVFCLLPRVTWAGTEGRSYAATMALAVLLCLAWLWAAERPGARWWVLYGAIAVLCTVAFLYLALLVVAHGVTALLRSRRVLRNWFIASAAAAILLLPFALLASSQNSQVHWISPINAATWHGIFVAQWFYQNNLLAIVGWALAVLGIVFARRRATLALVLPWLVVPTALLVLVSLGIAPLYTARYLTFSAPAVAILMAYGIEALRQRWAVIAALVLCAALTVPTYLGQRMPTAKDHSAWSQVADLVVAQRAREQPGTIDGVLWGPLADHAVASSRVIRYSYPAGFLTTLDITLHKPANRSGKLWESSYPLSQVTARLAATPVVWVITSTDRDWLASNTDRLKDQGYAFVEQWTIHGTIVQKYVR